MATPVTIPVRFGTRRFGKVVGGVLESDGAIYPQPGGLETWQPGMSILVAPPGTDATVETLGFKTNALLSGGNQQLYGKDIFGWIFCDTLNDRRWLIQPDLAGATADFDGTLSITFDVVRFGLFDGNGVQPFVEQTRTLANWGQSTPDITEYGDCTHALNAPDLFLVSAKTDGSVAIIMASTPTDHQYQELPWIHQWPVGFIGVTCTAVLGNPPTLALSVLRDRATTVGTRTDYATTGSLSAGTVCGGACAYESGSQTFSQGVTDAILALVYVDNALVEITASAEIAGSNICGEPYAELLGMAQDSTGTVRVTWTLSNGTDSVSWYYELSDAMHSYVNCSSGTATWSIDRTEVFNGETAVNEGISSGSGGMTCYLEHTDADTGTFGFAVNVACRAPGDLWEDHYTGLSGNPYISWGFRRYAYDVIGLYAEKGTGPYTKVRGDCVTPTGTIAAAALGTGDYGAYNARTGEAVAGQVAAVGYV